MFFSKMSIVTLMVALAVVISCQTTDATNQLAGSSQEQPKAQSEKPFDFLAEAPSYLGQLELLTAAQRLALFQGLAAGKTDGLTKLVGPRGALFVQAMRKIDGYRDKGNPSVDRLEGLFQAWRQSSGADQERLFALYRFWGKPQLSGFSSRWLKDLPTKKQNGRTFEGWQLQNNGDVWWPNSLEIEVLIAVPAKKGLKPPGTTRVPAIAPGATVDVYVDVTDFGGQNMNVYFISTFLADHGARCYIKPRPELGLGTIPEDALYITFKLP